MKHRLMVFVTLLLFTSAIQAADEIKIACVGDSITYGAGVEDREKNSYPIVLGRVLGGNYKTANFGVGGTTLLKKGNFPYWVQKAFKDADNFAPNIVIIMLGTNDTKPENMKFKEEFETDLAALVDHFAALPTKPKIYLCRPVPAYAVQWGINEQGLEEMVMPAIAQVAKAKGCTIIDLHAALSGKPELFPDKIHPNAAGAALMAKAVADVISAK